MRCVFWWNGAKGSERYDVFPRGPYGRPVSKFSFLPPGEICHGVRFSPLLISPPRLVGDLLGGTRALLIADERPGARRCHDDDGWRRALTRLFARDPTRDMTSVVRAAATRVGARAPLALGRRSAAPVVARLPRARARPASAVSTANDAPSTAADGTADIPEQQDAISVDGVSVGSLTKAILAMEDDTAEAMYECVMEWAMHVKGVELYEAQEEAIMELADGNSVLLTTPTGSGKTLVATAAIAAATARGDVRARSPRSPLVPRLGASDGGPPARRIDDRDLSARCSLFLFFLHPSPSPRRPIL